MTVPHSTIAVIVPVYNESSVIANTIKGILPYNFTVIVVDDGSNDNVREALNDYPVYFLQHLTNLGQGAALQTGISFARKLNMKYFVTFDADGQHNGEDIEPMVKYLIEKDLDIVIGSRFLGVKAEGMSRSRFLLLKIAIWVNYFFSGLKLSDAHNGFRVMNENFVKKVSLTENRMAHATEILMETQSKGLRYGEFPTRVFYTDYSKEKGQKSSDALKILQSLIMKKIIKP